MPESRYVAYARDPDRKAKGTIPYLTLESRVVFNDVGAIVLTADPATPKLDLIDRGWGLIVEDEETGARFASGPVRHLAEDQPEPGEKEPPRTTVTVTCVTDEWHLGSRIVYPTPSAVASSQTASAYYTASGVAETVLRALVNTNAGPGALAARRVAGLTLEGADSLRGGTVKVSARFDNLLDVLKAGALTGGIGFRIVQVGLDLQYQTYVPDDQSALVRFTTDLGNLRSYSFDLGGPDTTRAIVAGDGEGTARTVVERGNTSAETDWGVRVETFVDRRDTTDSATLQQAGDEELATGGPAGALSLTPIDSPKARYGHDYRLGTKVMRAVGGVAGADVVREVKLRVDDTGIRVTPLIGDDAASSPNTPRLYKDVRELARRMGVVEKRR